QGDYVLTYRAQDRQGNEAQSVSRKVRVVDPVLPLVSLEGPDYVIHEVGTPFSDPGATAVDQEDAAVAVTVSGAVLTDTLGTYLLSYGANDGAGYEAIPVTRTVVVVDANFKLLSYYIDKGKVIITDCETTASGDLVIPERIEGLPVTAIGTRAFSGCSNLVSILVPNGVKVINEYAFENCTKLVEVGLPLELETLGHHAFNNCSKLLSVALADSLVNLGEYAFQGCQSLEEVVLPTKLRSIPRGCFENCRSLVSITLPEGLTHIDENGFSNCHLLEGIQLPDSLLQLGRRAFSNCASLKVVELPENLTMIGYEWDSWVFERCVSLTHVRIPNGVDVIGEGMFYGCRDLAEIKIGKGTRIIGRNAFYGNASLKDIELPEGLVEIREQAFGGQANDWLWEPWNNNDMGSPSDTRNQLERIVIPSTVSSIQDNAFSQSHRLLRVVMEGNAAGLGGENVFQ
ncbi:MAG: leucine-rich repeat protein, partial [Limisphaerales bacterium]